MDEPIDLCIPLVGPRAAPLLDECLRTLYERNRMEAVTIHLVVKEERSDLRRVVDREASSRGAVVHICGRIGELHGTRNQYVTNWVSDTAGTCQWVIDHCGSAHWCLILHNDVRFSGDMIGTFRKHMTSEVGQIGHHAKGAVLYRRVAVRQCPVGFHSWAGLHAVRDDHGNLKLRHGGDPRCTDRSLPILGFDVGELLELNLCAKGWALVTFTQAEWNTMLYHRMGGSDYHQSETTFEDATSLVPVCEEAPDAA